MSPSFAVSAERLGLRKDLIDETVGVAPTESVNLLIVNLPWLIFIASCAALSSP